MKIRGAPFNPRPDLLELVVKASEDISPDDISLSEWSQKFIRFHSDRIAVDLELIQQYASTSEKLIEFGALPLVATCALRQLGYQVMGIDLAPERYSKTIRHLDLAMAKCDIETQQLPFNGGKFDVAIFNELFEHLRIDPIFTLREVLRVLKPGGRLLLSTPNLRSIYGIENFILHNKAFSCSGNVFEEYEKLTTLGHMGHVREYTCREVIDFLEKLGFCVIDVVYRGRYDTNIKQIIARLLPSLRPFVTYVAIKPLE